MTVWQYLSFYMKALFHYIIYLPQCISSTHICPPTFYHSFIFTIIWLISLYFHPDKPFATIQCYYHSRKNVLKFYISHFEVNFETSSIHSFCVFVCLYFGRRKIDSFEYPIDVLNEHPTRVLSSFPRAFYLTFKKCGNYSFLYLYK